jgi:hypothetical protein
MFVSKEEIMSKMEQHRQTERVNQLQTNHELRKKADPGDKKKEWLEDQMMKQNTKRPPPPKPIPATEYINRVKLNDIVEKKHNEKVEEIKSRNDMSELKEMVFELISLPEVDEIKRKRLRKRIRKSDTINECIDHDILFGIANRFSRMQVAAAIYAGAFFSVHNEKDVIIDEEPVELNYYKQEEPEIVDSGLKEMNEQINEINTDYQF